LALGIARAANGVFPEASRLLGSRLKRNSQDLDALSDLLLETRSSATDEAWLVLDDYHHLMRSASAERLVEQIAMSPSVRLLIATRRRPSWASARRRLYGEIEEVPRSLLAMTDEE